MRAPPVYLDYNATTPVAPEVFDAIAPYLREYFGNPSSSHVYGQRAKQALEQAREEVAVALGAKADEIIFTGSATEANNLAILGTALALAGKKKHLITSSIEHPSVMQPFMKLREEGWDVSVLPVDVSGRVNPQEVERAFRPDTALVSVMHANNETGAIQPISEIARLTRPRGILLHTDAAQSMGKIDVNVQVLGVDLLTLAGHKFYAPKGVGALYLRHSTPRQALLFGAGHEQGLRPGTENIALIAGFAAALKCLRERPAGSLIQIKAMRDQLHELLKAEIPGLLLNGAHDARLPNTLNVSFPGVSGSALLAEAAGDVAASTGSACHAGRAAASGVLGAMGLDADRVAGSVRLSVGMNSTPEEVTRAARALIAAWRFLVQGASINSG